MNELVVLLPTMLLGISCLLKESRAKTTLEYFITIGFLAIAIMLGLETWMGATSVVLVVAAIVLQVTESREELRRTLLAGSILITAIILNRTSSALSMIALADLLFVIYEKEQFGKLYLTLFISFIPAMIGLEFVKYGEWGYVGIFATILIRAMTWPNKTVIHLLQKKRAGFLWLGWPEMTSIALLGLIPSGALNMQLQLALVGISFLSIFSGSLANLVVPLSLWSFSCGSYGAIFGTLALFALAHKGTWRLLSIVPLFLAITLKANLWITLIMDVGVYIILVFLGICVGRVIIVEWAKPTSTREKVSLVLMTILVPGVITYLSINDINFIPENLTWLAGVFVGVLSFYFASRRFPKLRESRLARISFVPTIQTLRGLPTTPSGIAPVQPRFTMSKVFRVFQADLNLAWLLSALTALIIWRLYVPN